jgi:hypothetical protein
MNEILPEKNTLFWGINLFNLLIMFFVNKHYNDTPIQQKYEKINLVFASIGRRYYTGISASA